MPAEVLRKINGPSFKDCAPSPEGILLQIAIFNISIDKMTWSFIFYTESNVFHIHGRFVKSQNDK